MEPGNKPSWEQTNILSVALWKDGNVLLIQPKVFGWRQLTNTVLERRESSFPSKGYPVKHQVFFHIWDVQLTAGVAVRILKVNWLKASGSHFIKLTETQYVFKLLYWKIIIPTLVCANMFPVVSAHFLCRLDYEFLFSPYTNDTIYHCSNWYSGL